MVPVRLLDRVPLPVAVSEGTAQRVRLALTLAVMLAVALELAVRERDGVPVTSAVGDLLGDAR